MEHSLHGDHQLKDSAAGFARILIAVDESRVTERALRNVAQHTVFACEVR